MFTRLPGRFLESPESSVADLRGLCLMRANYEQIRGAMTAAGYITDQQFERAIASLDKPSFVMPSPLMWTVWGGADRGTGIAEASSNKYRLS